MVREKTKENVKGKMICQMYIFPVKNFVTEQDGTQMWVTEERGALDLYRTLETHFRANSQNTDLK